MNVAVEIGNGVATLGLFRRRILTYDGFSMAAGNIQHIGWLTQTGDMSAHGGNDSLPFLYLHPEMAGARRKVRVVEIIGFTRVSTKARMRSARMRGSSLMPFSSTDWLTMAMPASMRRAQAARASSVNSRGWFA